MSYQDQRTEEIKTCIALANGIDPRIQMNPPTLSLWIKTLVGKSFDAIHAAIELHYMRPAPPNRDRPAVDATIIRRIISEETDRAQAVQSAQKALPAGVKDPSSYRARNSEEWDRLYAKGRDDRRADLARQGIQLMDWQLANDRKPEPFAP